MGANAPRILSLSSNSDRLLDGQALRISVVATDPDGVDDLVGGVVRDPASERNYGALATAASEGAYSLDLSWEAIATVSEMSADFADDARVPFDVVLFDQAGNEVVERLNVAFHCEGTQLCDGECLFPSDDHCGACGRACSAEAGGAVDVSCQREETAAHCVYADWWETPDWNPDITCDAWCEGLGLRCADRHRHRDVRCDDLAGYGCACREAL